MQNENNFLWPLSAKENTHENLRMYTKNWNSGFYLKNIIYDHDVHKLTPNICFFLGFEPLVPMIHFWMGNWVQGCSHPILRFS